MVRCGRSAGDACGVRRVRAARPRVLRDARARRPLLLRAPLPARAVPLAAAHLLRGPRPLPPAGARLRPLRAPARLLLPPPPGAQMSVKPRYLATPIIPSYCTRLNAVFCHISGKGILSRSSRTVTGVALLLPAALLALAARL